VNIGGYLAAGPVLHLRMPGMVQFKPVHDVPDFVADDHLPKPQPPSATAPQATSKIVEPKPPAKGVPDINPSANLLGINDAQRPATPAPATPAPELAPK